MRLFVLLSSVMGIWTSAAVADTWTEYTYPELGFVVSFPADPVMETLPYRAPDGTTAKEILYSVRQGTGIYKVAVVDMSNVAIDGATAIDQAVNQLRINSEVRLDIPARVNRNRGRQLSLVGDDGSHSAVAIFFADHRLYQVQGIVLADSEDPSSGDAIRFQQSLRFIGNNGGQGFRQGFTGRQFRGGRRFQQDQNQPAQTPAAPVPESTN
jgi:hypothetical protein